MGSGSLVGVRIYTPAYELRVSCHHAATVAALVARGAEWAFAHDSVLPASRGRALRSAMDDRTLARLVMIDADCWIPPAQIDRFASAVDAAPTPLSACILPQRDGRLNAWGPGMVRLGGADIDGRDALTVEAIGTGIAIFNLAEYRAMEAAGLSPDLWWGILPSSHRTADGDPAWTGEDVFHCRALARAGHQITGLVGLGRHGAPDARGSVGAMPTTTGREAQL